MQVISLQSGSHGNSYYIESENVRLLIDAGISARQAELRLRKYGREIRDVDALLITHDHRDHTRGLGAFHRKFDLPIHITRKTLDALYQPGRLNEVSFFTAGDSFQIGEITIHSIPTPHDGVDGVAFVLECGPHRVGILTDLGHVFDGLRDVLMSLDAVVIESNYDESMLRTGPYPVHLKRRIQGAGGHISNLEAAELLSEHRGDRLQWACLCHLSNENNCPEVALRTHQQVLGDELPIFVAPRYESLRLAPLQPSLPRAQTKAARPTK